jgi:hypothetical protein
MGLGVNFKCNIKNNRIIRGLKAMMDSIFLKKGLRIIQLCLAFSAIMAFISLLAIEFINLASAQSEEKFTYYGVVPAKIFQYNLTNPNDLSSGWRLDTGSISNVSLVAVASMADDTSVRVYNLDNGTIVSETVLDEMEKHYILFPNGTIFKVETSKLASVLLLSYGSMPLGNESTSPIPTSFYMSTTGAYVGKEFVLMISQEPVRISYTIFALENAEVTITREDGDVKTLTLDANTYKGVMFRAFTSFRIESTGNILIQSAWLDGRHPFFVPAIEGGFLGKTFFSLSTTSWDPRESYGFRVSTAEDVNVKVWDLETRELMLTADITGGNGFGFKPKAPAIVVQSDRPIILEYIHNGSISTASSNGIYSAYGSGVGYFGVKPNEDTPFYLPGDSYVEAYIFASENTNIVLDGTPISLEEDSHFLLPQPGTHIIRSDKNVVVQVLHWPSEPVEQGLQYRGVQIPCIQTINVVQEVTLTPLGEPFPISYLIIGSAAAAIAVAAVFLLRKRRTR